MPITTAAEGATVRVLTFKQGLLSGVAHDLELAVDRFRIDWSTERVSATFDTSSLRVLHAVVSGQPAPAALSARDRHKIERTIVDEVLLTSRHPEASFESASVVAEGDDFIVSGTLALAGGRKDLSVRVHREPSAYTAELVLDQRSFGIVPYTAMLGALALKPEVKVRVRVPA
jgi:polyisoprenoid-binding protein YceI